MSFYEDRANVFLDDQRYQITYFCRKNGIEYQTCPSVFWIWVHAVRLRLPEANEEERAESLAYLNTNQAVASNDGVMTIQRGFLPFHANLRLPHPSR